MIQLVLIVCLSGSPDVCKEEQPLVDNITVMGCAVQGQLIAQEWLNEHPKWLLRGWRCRIGGAQKES